MVEPLFALHCLRREIEGLADLVVAVLVGPDDEQLQEAVVLRTDDGVLLVASGKIPDRNPDSGGVRREFTAQADDVAERHLPTPW